MSKKRRRKEEEEDEDETEKSEMVALDSCQARFEYLLYGIPVPWRRWPTKWCFLCRHERSCVVYRSPSLVCMEFYKPGRIGERVQSRAPPLCHDCNLGILARRRQVLEHTWFFKSRHGSRFFYELFVGDASGPADCFTLRIPNIIGGYIASRLFKEKRYLASVDHEFDELPDLLLS